MMWIYTIVDIETGEVVYYVISERDWIHPGAGRGVTGKRPLADLVGGDVMIDVKSFGGASLVLNNVGKPQRGDLLAQALFTRS